MQLRTTAVRTTSRGKAIWTAAIAATLCLFSATNASAALSGTYNANGTTSGGASLNGPAVGPYTVLGASPGFCLGPPLGCAGGNGVSGSMAVTGSQVTFTFFGTTNSYAGSFTINLTNFTSPITGVSYVGGDFNNAADTTITQGFTPTSLSFTFATAANGFDAFNGQTVTFNVATTAAAVPEPSSIILLTTIVAGAMVIKRRRLAGLHGPGE